MLRSALRLRLKEPVCLWATPVVLACDSPQSTLAPAGRDAATIAALSWWMFAGAFVIWAGVMALAIYALLSPGREDRRKQTGLFVIGGGALLPTIVLAALLIFGLRLVPELLHPGSEDGVRIHVSGEQWWWRVRYEMPEGETFELANELHLPVGERVPLWLESPDVVHAFWVPSLGGKVDLIPGRVNRLGLEATRVGHYRGLCAEYCGLSHARMMFDVAVVERREFLAWAAAQGEPARAPKSEAARRGAKLFVSLGCGACHTVRGTTADGTIGPDLTHVGSRESLAAGALQNDVESFERWLREPDQIKPGAHMPSFRMVSEADRHRLAAYLEGLK